MANNNTSENNLSKIDCDCGIGDAFCMYHKKILGTYLDLTMLETVLGGVHNEIILGERKASITKELDHAFDVFRLRFQVTDKIYRVSKATCDDLTKKLKLHVGVYILTNAYLYEMIIEQEMQNM